MRVVYPDTSEGVLAMLRTLFTVPEVEPASVCPDPQVRGVWLVTWPPPARTGPGGVQCIAYLAGHEDGWGRTRDLNDAEFADALDVVHGSGRKSSAPRR